MRSFEDTNKNVWDVRVTMRHLLAIRKRTGINLPALATEGVHVWYSAICDPLNLAEFLVVITEAERKKEGVSDDDFLEALTDEVLRTANQEFYRAYLTWMGDSRERHLLEDYVGKLRSLGEAQLEATEKKLSELGDMTADELVAKVDEEVRADAVVG